MSAPRTAQIDRVLTRLERIRETGSGYTARCPVSRHGDRQPSLSIGEGEDGRVLLKCHAGCTFEEIVTALNLTVADVFPEQRGGEGGVYPCSPCNACNGAT